MEKLWNIAIRTFYFLSVLVLIPVGGLLLALLWIVGWITGQIDPDFDPNDVN